MGQIAAVHENGLDAEARQDLGQDELAGSKKGIGGDDAIAGPDKAHQRGEHRGHAGRRRPGRLGSLQQRHALLEHLDRRIAEAGIHEARFFALEARFGALGRVVGVAGGQIQRL